MSHAAAQHLASYGRGGDTELVHMTKGEIKGLQALALAHGGSLTINPHTGLVEAGFLKRMLPMIAGAALAATGVGAPMAALMVGGGYGLATGSVKKGLLAGLSAYGGAGLTSSLGALGGETLATQAGDASLNAFKEINQQAVTSGLPEVVSAAQTTPASIDAAANAMANMPSTQTIAQQSLEKAINANNLPGLTTEQIAQHQANIPKVLESGVNPEAYMRGLGRVSAAQTGTTTGNIMTGLKQVTTSPTVAGSFIKDNALTLGSALLPAMAQDQNQKPPAGYTEDEYDRYLKGYRLSPNYQAYEAPRPNPYYQAQYAAEGGIMKLQGGGGPVERMSMANTAMNPQGGMYPQGMIDKTQYATPTQRPVSAEMVEEAPAYERSNPMLMAAGGQIPISLQGSVNLDQGNMASQGFSGAATVGSGMAPRFNGPMTGGPGMGPDLQNHMMRPQPAVFPGGPGGIGMQPQLAVLPRTMADGGIARYRSKGQVNVLQDYIDRQGQERIEHLPESVGIPRTGIFRDTDVDTARKSALEAAMIRLGKAGKSAGIKPIALPKTAIKGLGDISGATQDTTEAAAGGTMRYNLGGYSDGGRMLKGPGDGMSDSIPASIAGKQPARLADGEFVVPADVVSHLGNGSTDAGAKKLYGMMDRIRKARTGKKKQAPAVKASRYMPA
jgi:hypothetical protein